VNMIDIVTLKGTWSNTSPIRSSNIAESSHAFEKISKNYLSFLRLVSSLVRLRWKCQQNLAIYSHNTSVDDGRRHESHIVTSRYTSCW
jgi:hypothetical protein